MFVGITCDALDWNITLGFVLALLLSTGIFILIIKLSKCNKEKNYKLTCDNMSYTGETLKLNKRSAFNKNVIKAKPITDYNSNYHEAQYVFTSASVGGITTGGVTKIGDYHSIDASSTGKFELKYFCYPSNEYRKIKKIRLTKELAIHAQNNLFIKQFLKEENTLVLEKDPKQNVSEQVSMLIKSGRTDMATRYMKQNYFETQLTREECMKITDWLSDLDCEGETHTGKAQNTGLGMFISIALIVFSIFPITGLILSLATLSEIKKGKRLNVNAIIPKITLTVNIIATIACFVGGAIAIYLLG